MQLRRLRKPRGDEHLVPLRMPALKNGGAEFEVASGFGFEFSGNRRHTLNDKILRNRRSSRECQGRGKTGEKEQGAFHWRIMGGGHGGCNRWPRVHGVNF